MPNDAAFYQSWARQQSPEGLQLALTEYAFLILFGGDLGGPLPPALARSEMAKRDAVRAELERREAAAR